MPDTHAAYRGLEPQVAVMRAASGMSRTIDTRRPRKLTAMQWAQVDRHPEVKLLWRRKTSLKALIRDKLGTIESVKGTPIYEQYQSALHHHRNKRRWHQKALLKEVKVKYKREQPVIDIQRQLQGQSIKEEKTALKVQDYVRAERVRVIDSLFTFASSAPKEECKRRAKAIDDLTALCSVQEGRRTNHEVSLLHVPTRKAEVIFETVT